MDGFGFGYGFAFITLKNSKRQRKTLLGPGTPLLWFHTRQKNTIFIFVQMSPSIYSILSPLLVRQKNEEQRMLPHCYILELDTGWNLSRWGRCWPTNTHRHVQIDHGKTLNFQYNKEFAGYLTAINIKSLKNIAPMLQFVTACVIHKLLSIHRVDYVKFMLTWQKTVESHFGLTASEMLLETTWVSKDKEDPVDYSKIREITNLI